MKCIVVLIIKISNTIIWLELAANVIFVLISVVRCYSGNMIKKRLLQTVIERSCHACAFENIQIHLPFSPKEMSQNQAFWAEELETDVSERKIQETMMVANFLNWNPSLTLDVLLVTLLSCILNPQIYVEH